MILGMTTATFTLVHVTISLIGVGTGLVVLYGLLKNERMDGGTAIFLVSTVLTSVTSPLAGSAGRAGRAGTPAAIASFNIR